MALDDIPVVPDVPPSLGLSMFAPFARHDGLFAARAIDDPVKSVALTREQQFALLDAFGYEAAADMLSHGVLAYEASRRLGVSPMVFALWWKRAPAEARALAREVTAESAMARAEATLMIAPSSREDAVVQVALANHLHKIAAAMHPAVWNTGRARAETVQPLALVIDASMPGLQHLQVRALPFDGMPDQPVFTPEAVRRPVGERASSAEVDLTLAAAAAEER